MLDQAEKLRQYIEPTLAEKKSELVTDKRIIAVTSGKGGVGKTNISVNLSIGLAKLGKKVLLLDADIGMANVDLLVGLTPKFNLQHVLLNQKSLPEVLLTGPAGINIIPGVSGAMGFGNLTNDQKSLFFQELSHLEAHDYTIIDTSAGMSQNVMNFVLAADEVFVVTTSEPTAMMDAYAIIKTIIKHNPSAKIQVIPNMVASKKEAEHVFSTLDNITEKFLGRHLNLLGYLIRDVNVIKAVKNQSPFILSSPDSQAGVCIRDIVAQITKTSKPQGLKFNGLIRFFEQAFGYNKN